MKYRPVRTGIFSNLATPNFPHLIRKEDIESVLETARVEEVVSDFVQLKKAGASYKGLCPFHQEKTPSFNVNPAKGIFKCFGCGKAGNAVGFVMEHEKISFPEAVRYLAKKYHIELKEEEQTPEEIQKGNMREALFSINEFARNHFVNNLFHTEEGRAVGLSYFEERGFTPDIIKKFQLGYSPEKWDDLSHAAISNGYDVNHLLASGLSIRRDDGTHYDRFRGRVIFPFHSQSGRVTGFTSRILVSDKSRPKYVNSPESDVFNKSQTLYGLFFARNAILSHDLCYLVEGNTDVISLHQAGIENVVASSGTALTTEQIRIIRRHTSNITILYDGDAAGIKASLRGVEMILEEGMNVRIVLFPDGEDPDSFARKNSSDTLKDFITRNSVDFISFKLKLMLEETGDDPFKKAALVREIVSTIALVPDPLYRQSLVSRCSEMMNMPEQTLRNELTRLIRKKFSKKAGEETQEEPEVTEYTAAPQITGDPFDTSQNERYILELLVNYGHRELIWISTNEFNEPEYLPVPLVKLVLDDLRKEEITFSNPLNVAMLDELYRASEAEEETDESFFVNHPQPEISAYAIELMSNPYELSQNWVDRNRIYVPSPEDDNNFVLSKEFLEVMAHLKLKIVCREIENEKKLLKENPDDYELHVVKIRELQDICKIICNELNIVTPPYQP